MLVKKDFINKDEMNKLKISKNSTSSLYKKDAFIYDFIRTLKRKIEDPLGQRNKKRKR